MASIDVARNRTVAGADSRIVVRNSGVQLLRHAAIWGANVTLILFLPRYLGDQGLGQLQFAISFVSLFSFLVALGVRHYLIKEVARDRSRLQDLLSAALGLRIVMAVLVVALIAVAAELSGQSGTARRVVYLATAWMVITSFAHLLAATIHGLERMGWEALAEVVNKVLVVAVGVMLLLRGGDVVVYAAVMVAGSVVHLLMNAGYIGRRTPLRVDFSRRRMKALAVNGGPYFFMAFLLGAYANADVVMLRFMTGEAVVGWYAAAMQIIRAVEFFPVVLTTALLPTMARLHIANVETVAPMARKGVSATMIVMVPVAVGLSLVSDRLIAFFPYPEEFARTVPVLIVMAIRVPITALLIILGTIAIAMDRQRTWAIALTATLVLNALFNLVLIPLTQDAYGNGAIGAALATTITEGFMVIVGVALLSRVVFEKRLMATFGKVVGAAAAMGVVVYGAKGLGASLWPLVAAGVVSYALLGIALRIVGQGEIRFLWKSIADPAKRAVPPEAARE